MIRIFILLLGMSRVGGAVTPAVIKDLRPEWLIYSGGETYQRLGDLPTKNIHTIYFDIKATQFKGHYVSIRCKEWSDVFINGKLIYSGTGRMFGIDSLSNLYSQQMFFGIHSSAGIQDITTAVVSVFPSRAGAAEEIVLRPPTFFRDYAILVTAFLLLFLLILFRTNPQLTLDYFSFAKIFSVQERNENQLASRITSSVNLLFYLFCALLTGFLLTAIFHFAGSYFLAAKFIIIDSLGQALLVWLKLSSFILALLASKLIIVLLFSSLFNFRETVSFQFFNFLRFVLFTGVMMGILSLVYFLFKGGQSIFYERLIVLALVLLSAGSVMVLIKLLARAPFSFFHLFSYLCVSEIIPLVIIIKIFF